MPITIKFSNAPSSDKNNTAVVFVHQNQKLSSSAQDIDKKTKKFISRALNAAGNFTGKMGQTLIQTLPEGSDFERIVCLGLGDPKKLDSLGVEKAGGKLLASLNSAGITKAVLFSDSPLSSGPLTSPEIAAHIANGLKLRSYSFDAYKTKPKKPKKKLSALTLITTDEKTAKSLYKRMDATTQGIFTARNLVNEPPNTLYPAHYADAIKKTLEPLGVKVDILDEKKMKSLGMGAILAVGMGSARKPRMVIMQWTGTKTKSKNPLALVGKGVTFDTGGISIKPGPGMDEMKMDMGGSAAVVGTLHALALRKAKTDVIGVVGLAENMPSSEAYRPGDIIKAYNGKTIEVLNTDAEGRLVLADCLGYLQDKYKPSTIIDLATLTGAMMIALGHEYCGTFATHDALWDKLAQASTDTGEKLWRMPLDEEWMKDMESDVADVRNLAKSGRFAGACTAAGFLQHFIEGNTPWAHMDIAGTAWIKKDKDTTPKFGTGFGVRVLDQLVETHFE